MEDNKTLQMSYLQLQNTFLAQQRELNALQTEKVQQLIANLYLEMKQDKEPDSE